MEITNVIVRLRVEGIHCWPAAREFFKEEQVGFLSDPHRHMFHITAKKRVMHDDRDIEIIMFKREILRYLENRYRTSGRMSALDFGSLSCEMLAREISNEFDCVYVEVSEDGENGAEIISA